MASITDYFGQTGSATAPAPITTVKTARLVGETVLAYNSVPGFNENTPVFFVTYKKVTDPVTGEISAVNQTSGKALANTTSNTLTNIVIAPGYTDIGNAVGDFIEVIPTSYWADSLVTGLAVSLNPNGTLKTGSVTSTAIAAGAVTNAAIGTAAVKAGNIDFSTFPNFGVYLNTSQGSANGAIVTLNTKEYDTFNGFNTTTYRYVAPMTGLYHFSWNIQTSVGTSVLAGLMKNGVELKRGSWAQYSGSFIGSSGSTDVPLVVGDYVQLKCIQIGGTAIVDGGSSATYLNGHLC